MLPRSWPTRRLELLAGREVYQWSTIIPDAAEPGTAQYKVVLDYECNPLAHIMSIPIRVYSPPIRFEIQRGQTNDFLVENLSAHRAWRQNAEGNIMEDAPVLHIEINNRQPVELTDFTQSMAAFADAFKDYASANTADPLPNNMRLYVKSMREGSIIAEMVALTDQAQFIVKHVDVMAGFVGNLQDVMNFFLGRVSAKPASPTQREAR